MEATSLTVRSFMATQLVTFTPDMEIMDAMHALLHNRITGAPVIDSRGELVGMLSEHDCIERALSACYHGELGGRVESVMTRDVQTVDPDESILVVAEKLIASPFRRFVVMERNRVVGQLSRTDVLRALDHLCQTKRQH
ncbi:MAG: CBS domain-containing protein [Gammaproteobacteria bacterium]|nr:CBS domain-containing protein [Gammaproteobacteria bacterium]